MAVVITGLLEAIAWVLNHFHLHLNSVFLAAGADLCVCGTTAVKVPFVRESEEIDVGRSSLDKSGTRVALSFKPVCFASWAAQPRELVLAP